MSLFASSSNAYFRDRVVRRHDLYDIWHKVAQAVRPALNHVPAKVLDDLCERFWVAHPDFAHPGIEPLGSVHPGEFCRNTPYTDVEEFYTGAVWSTSNVWYMEEFSKGRVPGSERDAQGLTTSLVGVVDCRGTRGGTMAKTRCLRGCLQFP